MRKHFVLVYHRDFEQYCGIYEADSDEGLAASYIDKHFQCDTQEEKDACMEDFESFMIEPEVGNVLAKMEDFHPRDVDWVKERALGGEEYCAGMNDGIVAFLQQFKVSA